MVRKDALLYRFDGAADLLLVLVGSAAQRDIAACSGGVSLDVERQLVKPRSATKPLAFDDVLDRMTKAVSKMNVEKIKVEDLARSGGAPEAD